MARFFILSISYILLAAAAIWSSNSKLDQAWEEYRYKNFGMAEQAFKKLALPGSELSDHERYEAQLGLALVYQYRVPRNNPQKALDLEKSLSARIPATDSLSALVHLMLGRAYLLVNTKSADNAAQEFTWVVDHFPASIQANEAVLELSILPLASPSKSNIEKTIAALEKAIETRPADEFLVIYHMIAGRFAVLIGEWEQGRGHLMKAIDLGLPNPRDFGTYLFEIAYVSDKYLNDPKTAIAYYQRLVTEVLTDCRKTYCEQRIDSLKKELK